MKLTIKETIQANHIFLFDLTQDYSQRNEWDSFMKSAQLLTKEPVGEGSKLLYTTHHGMNMTVQYQAYKRGKIASIRMISDDWFLKKFAGGWRFKKIDEHTTEVIFAYTFEAKYIKKILNPIFAKYFQVENTRRIKKLKKHAEVVYNKDYISSLTNDERQGERDEHNAIL